MDKITLNIIDEAQLSVIAQALQSERVNQTYMVPDLTDEAALKLAQRLADLSKDPTRYVRGVYAGSALVGFLNDTEVKGECIELGWVIHPDHHNRGYATEAAKLAIKELFERGFKEVLAGAFAQNISSQRVMEKSGMTRIELTEEIEYRGQTHHCVYYHICKGAK